MMPDETKNPTAGQGAPPEIQNEDLQLVLKALLAAYEPILKQELKLAGDPAELSKAAAAGPPSCADEIARADQVFGAFFTDEIAQRMLSPEVRKILGPVDQWRWCLQHVRCCIIFGWLACRGPRNFRAFSYYLYQYWICVRQALGTPVSSPPAPQERADFGVLVEELAVAFKPYLTDQLATVEFASGIPEEIIGGRIDCREGIQEVCEIFERALTPRAAEALLGKDAFTSHSQVPSFWFCRCWCLCAICFGCCLARARSLAEVLWCLIYFFRCLERCLQPLVCQITDPHDCVEEEAFPIVGILRGVEIKGTASGFSCDHYELQWSLGGPWQSLGIIYPGLAPQGACGVVNGTLGYLQTFPFVPAGSVDIRLCVYPIGGGSPTCCPGQFTLQRNLVWIQGIENVNAVDLFDPTSQPVDGTGAKRSFGNEIRINGSAVVGAPPPSACADLKRYTLSYQPGFTTTTAGAWKVFWEVDYTTPLQIDAGLNKIFQGWLTSSWRQPNFPPGLCSPFFGDYLQEEYWSHLFPESFPVVPSEPPCPPPPFWTTVPLPLADCQSGPFTLRLTTEDTGGVFQDNLRQVWFDNKQITPSHAHITQIKGVDPCATVDLRQFAPPGGDCSVAWSAALLGVAYDETIQGPLPQPNPIDNFGGYSLWIKKDGTPDPGVPIPIPGPGVPPWGPPFVGTNRVGDPGGDICPYTTLIPPPTDGILAMLDMRRLDAVCNPAEPALTLKRGECCGYVITLLVWDNSICPGLSDGRHELRHTFPVCICNHVGITP
ncbi:MAG: hypothetical protein WBW33_17830 [Bryobacteraceae bacterium]